MSSNAPAPDRAAEVRQLLDVVTRWAVGRPDVRALALVGSWARDAAAADSDVDLLLLTNRPDAYGNADEWIAQIGAIDVVRREQWGQVAEVRVRLRGGVEVEFGITSPDWAAIQPLDAGTRRVAGDGLVAIYDPDRLLAALLDAIQRAGGRDPVLRIRHVLGDEGARLRELRIASLTRDPDAFGSTHAWEAALPDERWQRWAAESDRGTGQRTFVVVDEDDRWLGLAVVRRHQSQPDTAIVLGTWVSPEIRCRGVASRLCDACATWAGERGMLELSLDVVVGNDAALRAYKAAGFQVGGQTTWSERGRTIPVLVLTRPV